MADTLAILSTVLHYACWPVSKLAQAIAVLLAPFWSIAQFVLLPITSLAHAVLTIVLLPFRLHLLHRVETIYIYLGIAGLIGCIAGAILHFSFSFLSSTLHIDAATEAKARVRGRTAAAYRAARRRRRADMLGPSLTPTMERKGAEWPRQRGLLSQTIIEEEDSDF